MCIAASGCFAVPGAVERLGRSGLADLGRGSERERHDHEQLDLAAASVGVSWGRSAYASRRPSTHDRRRGVAAHGASVRAQVVRPPGPSERHP